MFNSFYFNNNFFDNTISNAGPITRVINSPSVYLRADNFGITQIDAIDNDPIGYNDDLSIHLTSVDNIVIHSTNSNTIL